MPCCYAACGPTDHRRASDNSRLPRRRHSRPTSSRGVAESTDGPRSSHLAPARQGLEQLTKPSAGAAHAPGHRPMQTRTPSRLGGFMNVRDSRDEPPQQRLAVGRIPGSLRRDSKLSSRTTTSPTPGYPGAHLLDRLRHRLGHRRTGRRVDVQTLRIIGAKARSEVFCGAYVICYTAPKRPVSGTRAVGPSVGFEAAPTSLIHRARRSAVPDRRGFTADDNHPVPTNVPERI